MPDSQKPKPTEFKLRMSPELKAIIDDVRGKKSVNQQINEWLWSKAQGDEADRLANALRPVLARLTDAERDRFVENTISNAEILSGIRKRSHRK